MFKTFLLNFFMRFGILPVHVFRTLQNPVDIRLFHDFEDMERTRSPNV